GGGRDRGGERAGLGESSPPRFPGDDRPGRGGRADRPEAVAAVGSAVPMVASPRGRGGGPGPIRRGDGPAGARGPGGAGGPGARRLWHDAREVGREPAGGGEPVDFRGGAWGATGEQCGGARRAACGDLAADQRGDRQRGGEPVRRADVDGGSDVPAARPGLA